MSTRATSESFETHSKDFSQKGGVVKAYILTALVGLTVIMQAVILYRQPRPATPPPPIIDAPRDTYVDLADFPARGRGDARTVLLEFSDYECPFCARHATTVFPQLLERFVETGRIRYAFANNPLPIHPNAKWLAQVAMCSGDQGQYWSMHHHLFASVPKSQDIGLVTKGLTIDQMRLDDCVTARGIEHARLIKRDQELATRLGLVGTPAFAVGRIETGTRVRVLKLIKGAVPIDVFIEAIEATTARS